jgi:hypothetical protein
VIHVRLGMSKDQLEYSVVEGVDAALLQDLAHGTKMHQTDWAGHDHPTSTVARADKGDLR